MRSIPIRAPLLGAALCVIAMTGSAQSWDAAVNASSWAKQDRDDSFAFYDSAAKSLRIWIRDGGLLGTIPTGRLDGQPERWAIDPRGNAWVAHGTTLTYVDRTGRTMGSVKLPAEVGDLCWDAKGIILSYRTPEPYLEKRDFRSADVLWSFGAKPVKHEGTLAHYRRPIVL
ncbi:MAG TPA: hypothetical protein VFV26_06490, partial [Geothrix sp.]|nr:hypothetical protein [Geothrix sp.]